jgi:hypothetical protein
LKNLPWEGKQMAAIARLTGAPSINGNNWKAINWQKVRREVRRLQIRIAKAVRDGRYGRVKALQWLLTRSFSSKALAVKRVVSNRGRKTPGVDGAIWCTPKQGYNTKEGTDNRVSRQGEYFGVLEPYDGKLSRTVLRGVGSRKAPCLPGMRKKETI